MKHLFLLLLLSFHFTIDAQDGNIDTSFGAGGKVITDFSSNTDLIFDIKVQTDSKIVVAGYSTNSSYEDFSIARYNSNGSPDVTFGTGGKVISSFSPYNDRALQLVILPGSKMLVAGFAANPPYGNDFLIARFNSNGSLDSTFGINGKVMTDFSGSDDQCDALAIQMDGKIIAGGKTQMGTDEYNILVRFNNNGNIDSTFGTNGKIYHSIGYNYNKVQIKPDGKIIASNITGVGFPVVLNQFNSNGVIDSTFGTYGEITNSMIKVNRTMALRPDGKILIAGEATLSGGCTQFSVACYHPNGSVDTGFGTAGITYTDFPPYCSVPYTMILQPDGKFLLAGTVFIPGSYNNFALVRYLSNGNVDSTFGSSGRVTTIISNFDDKAVTAAIQPDGKILVAGYSQISSSIDFAIVRYNNTVGQTEIGIKENNSKVNVDVYPNPANNYFVIDPKKTGPFTLTVTDISGKAVHTEIITEGNKTIITEGWAKGIYFYSIKLNDQVTFGKLVIQ
jgi:uncharacterized delta-60 repeat protein